ncbi:MAG: diguanylate cyclase [Xanthomonadales bacterium]|nr:diguanylate cyclase [Xanthomonadales bacterium]MBK7144309.1 diguanylate cyclase [Xanthomonadales bacterium]MCC6559936.1 diguanylate cyclase [Xanthomonadales bacterium]
MSGASQHSRGDGTWSVIDMGALRGRRAQLFALLMSLLWLAFVLVPVLDGRPPSELVFACLRAPLLALAALLCVHHGLAHLRPGRVRRSWVLIGAAIGSVFLGEAYRAWQSHQGVANAVFGPPDVFYLAYFPLLLVGLLQLPRVFSGYSDLAKFVLDCATVAVGGGMFVWHFAIRPALVANAGSDPQLAWVAIAYPVGDLLTLLGIATVLLRLPVGPTRLAYVLLAAALAASLAGDLAWVLTKLLSGEPHQVLAEALWFLQALIFVFMVSSARRHASAFNERRDDRVGRFAVLPYLALVAGYALIAGVVTADPGDHADALPSLLRWGALLIACVLVRQALASREMAVLVSERTRLSSESRLAKLIENAADGIFVLDRELRVRYASPSALRLLATDDERLRGQPISAFLPADDAESLRTLMASLDHDTGRRSGKLVLRFAGEAGAPVWAETTVTDQRHDPALGGVVLNVRDVSAHHRLEEQMQHEALHDALTQLPNRELFLDRVSRAAANARRSGQQVAVAVLDLDQFRLINDSLGHATGDQVIVLVAERLRGSLRGGDTLARLGADEFALMLDDSGDPAALGARLDRVLASFAGPFRIGHHSLRLSAGIGVAVAREGASAEDLLRDADTAVSTAKQAGPNRYHVFEAALHARVVERLAMQAAVPEALDHDRFLVQLQPVVGLADGYPIALRPRLRWRVPAGAPFAIERVRDVVGDIDVAFRLSEWVLATAQREYTSLLRYQPAAGALSLLIPLDHRHIQHAQLVPRVSELLDQVGMPAVNLMVAVSEDALGGDHELALRPLRQLRGLGVRLALARFGSRASSLAALHEPLFDAIILSRSLSQALHVGGRGHALVRGVIAMAEALGARAIATGVDSEPIRDALIELGCLYGIGSALAQPMPLEHLLPWLGGRLSESGR